MNPFFTSQPHVTFLSHSYYFCPMHLKNLISKLSLQYYIPNSKNLKPISTQIYPEIFQKHLIAAFKHFYYYFILRLSIHRLRLRILYCDLEVGCCDYASLCCDSEVGCCDCLENYLSNASNIVA